VAAAPAIIRREVEEQKLRDLDRGDWQGVLMARMGAVVEAQRLIRLHESAATPALRQALIDLASIAELLASELAAPSLAQEAAWPARAVGGVACSTGLTFGTIASLYGLTAGIIDETQFSLLITVVVASALIPTAIAQTFFHPIVDLERREQPVPADEYV
jgi:hypothetical protein